MDNSNTICPVCTLYLREGVTLQAHLDTHPKDQVIEALLKVSNAGSTAQASETPTTTSSSFVPVQSFANSNSSFLSQSAPFINPQTQMTTAVTYQHFMTNGSGLMPQYIQVPAIVNPNSSIPVISSQSMDFVPTQAVNYSQTMYNPLYNPYIPHPYPFTQPVFTSFPMSALPVTDSNTQLNQTPASAASGENSSAGTSLQTDVLVNKCTVATSTDLNKKSAKIRGTKKSFSRLAATSKKVKIIKQKLSDSSSRLIFKSSLKTSTSNLARYGMAKRSVIKTVRPKTIVDPSSSTKMICPPLIEKSESTKKSLSDSETLSSPSLVKAPCNDDVKSEDVTDRAVLESETYDTFSNLSCDESTNLEKERKLSTVIVNPVSHQNSNNEDIKSTELEVVDTSFKDNENELVKNPLSFDTEEMNSNKDSGLCSKDSEALKVFQMIEVGEENKTEISEVSVNQDIPKKISSENIERNCDGSDIFIQQENILLNDDVEKETERKTQVISCLEVVEPDKNPENSNSNEYIYHNDINDSSSRNECVREDAVAKPSEIQAVTYTDLQPAKSSRVFEDLGLPTSLNFNSFMEVDGIKIIFNSTPSTVQFDPLMKLAANGRNITAFMKTENQVSNRPIVDSVIQLVSGNSEAKNELTYGDNFTATTSQMNDMQLDLPDLSPLALNIQADESMPARGELSEQESLGAENSTWNLFHGNSATNTKTFEEWRNENSEPVSVVGSKKGSKSFKCSICNELFSCPKERRVHKNTVHLNKAGKSDKVSSSLKKPKSYACSFCSEVFTSLRDRKAHAAQVHQNDLKNKKVSNPIKEENAEPEPISVDEPDSAVKNETERDNVKTENSLPSAEAYSHRIKYCTRCSLPFFGVKKLREHLRLVHGEVRFKCETCSACFDEEPEYNDHLLIHPLVCDKCGKAFHKKPNLNLHMKRHLDVKPYVCTLCPKSFITRQKLEEHTNSHSGKKPLKCTLCDKTFSRHSNLIQHRNLHHLNVKKKIKDFVCRCGEVFHSLRKLEWHKEVHEPKPKPCPFCSQKFIHSASVTRHIRRAHLPDYLPGENREFDNVQCPICEKVYLRSSLVVHMRVHNGEKPFACKICNKRFSTKWNLELHSWTHQSRSNMPFKCQICKSAFFRETDFVAHLNSHRNYKPFTCNICGQKFIRKYSCLRHQEEHKKSKQFVCAVSGCAKSFHRGYYLRDHMKVHTGVRPHTCHICGKASSTKSNHNKHVRIHDTREPVNTEN